MWVESKMRSAGSTQSQGTLAELACDGPAVDKRKADIFSATLHVALKQGFGKVTLEAVAAEAKISKGGLLHHFATKVELIQAMLQHFKSIRRPNTQFGANQLAIAALIAAAEDPTLLNGIADLIGLKMRSRYQNSTPKLLAKALANRVRLEL